MKLTLKNIGLIKNSEIKLDGLTVITGHNNSGKTTVGKALYACIEGASDIENRFTMYKVDFLKYLVSKFTRIYQEIIKEIEKLTDVQHNIIKTKLFKDYIDKFSTLFTTHSTFEEDCYSLNNFLKNEQLSHSLNDELSSFSFSLYFFQQQLDNEVLQYLQKIQNIKIDDFVKRNINNSLQKEFSKQIQPVKNKSSDLISEIIINDNNVDLYKLIISDNELIDEQSNYRFFAYKKGFLIDNPFIIDELKKFTYNKKEDNDIKLKYKTMFQKGLPVSKEIRNALIFSDIDLFNHLYLDAIYDKNYTHNYKLKIALSSDEFSKNVFEKFLDNYNDNMKNITNLLHNTIPGEVIAKKHGPGFEYVHKDYNLSLSNLATGTKLFSIMKTLIEKGAIDNETMLILDEPESHLHPEWQNIFAELLVLLVKDVNCRILLTTHSPNFLLAIEAFMYKHSIVDKCNFYKTQFNNDNETVDYVLTNNTNEIYGDFVKFLSQVKNIRNTYAHYKEDIDNE